MLGTRLWVYAAAILGLVIAVSGAGLQGYRMGRDSVIAQQARDEQIRMETLQLAQLAAAEEIAKIQIRHTTIRQTAEKTIREVPVYRDCANDPELARLLDSARANRPAEPAGTGSLP